MLRNTVIILLPLFLFAQTEPTKDLHKNRPKVWTLTNAMIHTSPGDFIKDGSIVIRKWQD